MKNQHDNEIWPRVCSPHVTLFHLLIELLGLGTLGQLFYNLLLFLSLYLTRTVAFSAPTIITIFSYILAWGKLIYGFFRLIHEYIQ